MDSRFERLLNHQDYTAKVGELEIHIKDGVFSPDPDLTHSPSLILKHLPYLDGALVADIGCGTGVISVACALQGAEYVIAADISDTAIQNTRLNVKYYKLENMVNVRQSDLFSTVPENFDFIFANLPILDEVWSKEDGSTNHLIQKFLIEATDHLKEDGAIFLPWASFSNVAPLKTYLERMGWKVSELQEEVMGYIWYLFVIKK